MCMCESLADLCAGLDRGGVLQLAGAKSLTERLARDELVRDVHVSRVAGECIGAQAARMPQACGGGGLALGPRGGLSLAGHDLQGDVEPVLLVPGEPDRPRAAGPERAQRAVAVEDEPGAVEGKRSVGHGSELVGRRKGVSSLTEARDTVSPDPRLDGPGGAPMSNYDDDDIEFDFFDEPETVEATQRRRLPRLERPGGGRGGGDRPPRAPMRAPTGLVPLARLVGLIAIAIVIVVGLVFWVGSCQGKSKQGEYRSYAGKVRQIATADNKLGVAFRNEFLSANLKVSDLEAKLQDYAQQEQQAYQQAQQIRPPGPLRAVHQNLIDAIELRAKGLAGLGDALAAAGTITTKNATATSDSLTKKGELLTASDVVWEQLYRTPATQTLTDRGITGVVIPSSQFVPNTDVVSARAFSILVTRLTGASTGGTPSGKHGDALVSVRALPQGTTLTNSTAATIKVTTDLSFVATVEDSGGFPEVSVPVTLTIDTGGGKPIKKRKTIALIQAGEQRTVSFGGFDLPQSAYGNPSKITVFVSPVHGEINTGNNSATYTAYFTLP